MPLYLVKARAVLHFGVIASDENCACARVGEQIEAENQLEVFEWEVKETTLEELQLNDVEKEAILQCLNTRGRLSSPTIRKEYSLWKTMNH